MIPGLLANSFTNKNSVVVSLSGSCLPPHSHSNCEGSSFSFPCEIILLFSSMISFESFFLSWTLILSINTLIENPPDFFTIDELLGLKLGADDFVKKSGGFSIKVLIERIRVQLRKKDINNNLEDTKNIISHGKLKLDPSQLECEWDSKQLPDKLTTTEFLIVKELAKRPGIIKERAQLMDIAYREDTDIEDRTIDSHVKRIRKKFKKVDPDFTAIETRYGSGYRWNVS